MKVTVAGTVFSGSTNLLKALKSESGTGTTASWGSIVVKGLGAVSAKRLEDSALKSVDFPTFGKPIIPISNPKFATSKHIILH